MNSNKRKLEDGAEADEARPRKVPILDALVHNKGTARGQEGEGQSSESINSTDKAKTSTSPNFGPLVSLLDISDLKDEAAMQARFNEVADILFNEYHICVQNAGKITELAILEMEFYVRKQETHDDPFTHGSVEQKVGGRWYFHRAPKRQTADVSDGAIVAGGYRGGSRKGMDLTIAEPPELSPQNFLTDGKAISKPILRGGILLRSIRHVKGGKFISGPSLLVDEILRLCGVSEIPELVSGKWDGDIRAFRQVDAKDNSPTLLFLKQIPRQENAVPFYRSPRIGLDLSHPDAKNSITNPRVAYVSKPYRYYRHPHLLTANGRGQTFLGVYLACQALEKFNGKDFMLRNEVMKITGLKEKSAIKYIADYKEGLNEGSLATFIGPKGKGASASPASFLKLMGTLERARRNAEA